MNTTTENQTDHYPACDECGDPIDYCTGHPSHWHYFRADIKDMWCHECDTVTDFCQQINPS